MLIKAGVDISRLRSEIRKKLFRIQLCLCDSKNAELIITSTYEGTHSPGSLHYANLAIDIRLPSNPKEVVTCLKKTLGDKYDVVHERNHIHIEYDPKY